MSKLPRPRGRTKAWVGVALAGTGLTAGAILGSTLTAGASTYPAVTSSSTSGSGTSSGSSSTSGSGTSTTPGIPPADGQRPPYRGLPDSGTVSAVGSSSVTISGTTYAVTSNSDIDKNGEASLSSLAVGDKVTFSTDSSTSTPTIDRLHAGDESLDRPTGPPAGAPGSPPSSGSSSSGSSSTSGTLG